MEKQRTSTLIEELPLAVLATFLVIGVPALLVLTLRVTGAITSFWAEAAIGVAGSLLLSYAGSAFWETRTNSRDTLFSELMVWGWVQRWRSERRLDAAADLLGIASGHRRRPASDDALTYERTRDLLTRLTSQLEARDAYTHGHSRRVARHASNIAQRMGLPEDQVARVRAAGAMHDVGKVHTPIEILRKPDKLSDAEYEIVKRHPVDGAVMIAALHDDELTAMVRHHHERLDGTGYPDGLAAEEIPIGARILAVADTFDAVTSSRPYRSANPHKKGLDILTAEAGSQLDPDAVRAFCSYYSGRGPFTWWTILVNGAPRLAAWLGATLAPAGAGALATAAIIGGTTLTSPGRPPSHPNQAVAEVGAPVEPSAKRTPARSDSQTAAPGPRNTTKRSSRENARPPNRGVAKPKSRGNAPAPIDNPDRVNGQGRDQVNSQGPGKGQSQDTGQSQGESNRPTPRPPTQPPEARPNIQTQAEEALEPLRGGGVVDPARLVAPVQERVPLPALPIGAD